MKFLITFFLVLIAILATSCYDYKNSTAEIEQRKTEVNQSKLIKAQPPVSLDWSLERDQINRRTTRWNDKNKTSYVYLLSDMGTIIAYFPIKGKVSSVNSQITNPEQLALSRKGAKDGFHYVDGVLPSPAEDGSYGTNGDGIFFFLTDGTYMEWNGKYLLCDNYIKLTQKPVLTYSVK